MPRLADLRTALTKTVHVHGLRIAIDLGLNVAGPLMLYYAALDRWGAIAAIAAAAILPLTANGLSYARTRRMDALSIFAIASVLSPLLTTIGGGSGQTLLIHQKLPLLLFGLAFLGSAVVDKPLIFPLARATVARESAAALALFEARVGELHLGRTMMVMTIVWGLALLAEFSMNAFLIYGAPIRLTMTVGPILGYVASAALLGWTIFYRFARRRAVTV